MLNLILFLNVAYAAEMTSTSSLPLDLSRMSASYAALVQGPTMDHLDANTDGKGTNMVLKNFIVAGYNATQDFKIEAGDEFRQYFRPEDPKDKNRSDFQFRDPFVGVAQKELLRNEPGTFTLGSKLRYFIPISDHNRANLGKAWNEGNGVARIILLPRLRLLDGVLTAEFYTDANYRFARNAPPVRQDYYFRARPSLQYQFARKVAAKVEYHTGDLSHGTNGKWSKFNDPLIGQMAYAGIVWTPSSSLMVNPQVGWGSNAFRLNRGQLSVYGTYAFL